MKTVIVIRGISGAGKSTFIQKHFPNAVVCSADHFFSENGDYKRDFDPRLLGEAHATCLKRFIQAVSEGQPLIVVDNTHIHVWECLNYVDIARYAAYAVRVISIMPQTIAQLQACAKRTAHFVPKETIAAMAINYEPWVGEEKYLPQL